MFAQKLVDNKAERTDRSEGALWYLPASAVSFFSTVYCVQCSWGCVGKETAKWLSMTILLSFFTQDDLKDSRTEKG